MKRITIALLALFLASSVVFAKGKKMGDIKIAVIDWALVISQSPIAKEGDDAVAKLREREEAKILEFAKQLQEKIDKTPAAQKTTVEEEAKAQISKEIDKMTTQVTELTSSYITKTLESVNATVKKVANKLGIDMVLNKQAGIVYSTEVIDITSDVIKELGK